VRVPPQLWIKAIGHYPPYVKATLTVMLSPSASLLSDGAVLVPVVAAVHCGAELYVAAPQAVVSVPA
jgi:hypothetical protein